jgi:hypothetical protein
MNLLGILLIFWVFPLVFQFKYLFKFIFETKFLLKFWLDPLKIHLILWNFSRFHRRLLIDNRLKKLNTTILTNLVLIS